MMNDENRTQETKRESKSEKIPISICILTKDSELKIARCLDRLDRFDEIILLDTGSTDRTLDIVQQYGQVKVFHQDGIDNFGETRNMITEKAKNDWVLHVDSDEFLAPQLVDELARQTARGTLQANTVYAFRHRMYYRGKALPPFDSWLRRLYNRKTTAWSLRAVHEALVIRDDMKVVNIRAFVEHHSYDSVDQLIHKAQLYSSLFADQFYVKKNSSVCSAVGHGGFTFFKHYFVRGCIWYGYNGFIVALCFSLASFLKYVKLLERNQDHQDKPQTTVEE